LDHGDAAAPPVTHTLLTRPGPQLSLDGAVKQARHGRTAIG